MRPQALDHTQSISFEKEYTLSRKVSAIQILRNQLENGPPSEKGVEDHVRLGLMTQLPEGAQVQVSGPGFDDQTVRVRCGEAVYYIFLADLELQRKGAASAAAS